jgi:hypothetical protein
MPGKNRQFFCLDRRDAGHHELRHLAPIATLWAGSTLMI